MKLGNMDENGEQFFSNFQSVSFGAGFALIIALFVSVPNSGGHINPAVTVTFVLLKKCSWRQVCMSIYLHIYTIYHFKYNK